MLKFILKTHQHTFQYQIITFQMMKTITTPNMSFMTRTFFKFVRLAKVGPI
jgi:hypothetical protein